MQEAFLVAELQVASELVSELHGNVRKLISSAHGNYVVQKIVEVLPSALSSFVADELRNVAISTARHKFGCRVLLRLIENCPESLVSQLVVELLSEIECLCRDRYAHLVVQAILEHGTQSQKRSIVDIFETTLWGHAQHCSVSYVLETALTHCEPQDQQALAARILSGNSSWLASVAASASGAHVLAAILTLPREILSELPNHVLLAFHLGKTGNGQRQLRKTAATNVMTTM